MRICTIIMIIKVVILITIIILPYYLNYHISLYYISHHSVLYVKNMVRLSSLSLISKIMTSVNLEIFMYKNIHVLNARVYKFHPCTNFQCMPMAALDARVTYTYSIYVHIVQVKKQIM